MAENDFEELEELEEEPLDDTLFPDQEISSPEDTACLNFWKTSYRDSTFPFAIMDNRLRILWTNNSFTLTVGRGENPQGKYFTSLFAETGNQESINDLYKAVLSDKAGHSWKGRLETKDREHLSLIVNSLVFPVHSKDREDSVKPEKFGVVIDDLTEENRELIRGTFTSLLEASKLKDNDTGQHIERVNEYSRCLAESLYGKEEYTEVDKEFIDNISFLAAMHDVGKIGTPDDILNKQGPLDPREWKIMQEHTINGAYILSTYPNPMAKEIALFHHEKWDGSGYPYKLSESLIPLSARVVAIADVYDALRMKRSYKEPFSHGDAMNILSEKRGTHFDPYLMDFFLENEDVFRNIFEQLGDD